MYRIFRFFADKCKTISKYHFYHLIFGISILSLASLVVWWAVFIDGSIERARQDRIESLETHLDYFFLTLGSSERTPPSLGQLEQDRRFEIVSCMGGESKFLRKLEPFWPGFCLRVREPVLSQIERKFKRQKLMVAGESGVMILVIFTSLFFLYRYVQLEKRTAKEVKEFWERSAHELKTPIAGVKAFLQSLENHTLNFTQESMPFLRLALDQVKRQEQLAENILSAHSLRSKHVKLKIADVNLDEFVFDYFKNNALHLSEAAVSLRLPAGRQTFVRASRHALKVILDNITGNAVKYGSPLVVLTVELQVAKKKAVLSIADNGPGFPAAMANRIFSAYKHLAGELPAKSKGAGIGLHISRQLAHQMGGNLIASSAGVGKGAQFQIHLNLSKPE